MQCTHSPQRVTDSLIADKAGLQTPLPPSVHGYTTILIL
jgi:hypothetical protein